MSEIEPRGEEPRNDIDPADPSDPMPNPGLPEHQWRPTDVDPAQERRAERQVAGMFGLAALLALAFCVCYFAVPLDTTTTFLGFTAQNFALGLTLGGSLLLIGLGAIQWAKKLMADHEVIEMRHPARSSDEDRETTLGMFNEGVNESGFGRRPLIRNSLFGALGILGLPAIVLLRDLGPLPGDKQFNTVWTKGMRIANDVSGKPIRPSEIEEGQLTNAEPEILFEVDEDGEPVIHGTEALQVKAKAAVILMRMPPQDITAPEGRENWSIDGILCYSKICTHVGCPISLYEQQTHHVLCPCHQSTFDLADGGKVIFGPAHRALPQLQLGVDDEGYLIAMGDFEDVVGPSFPEIHQEP
ncbi:cytochrome bc1 complex Rieske iron-sulfur subunit [Solicola gregarius]|uniref:Cytochrome bc1 complex Rieske iron-sulfur subunit n=1 Tax=Solicola gregarius TaxID=2908642 RepID=A0AA46YLA8_9ACTN|nr:Rieske 2Fe-2S domain-containing protein [Solicola gregarius]UYM05414.1 Rieske 2Fe-2S domain-containing protein [Solicola gregarius]